VGTFSLRIVQISDFHFTRSTWNPLKLFSKRLLGYGNWLFSRTHAFSEEILAGLPVLFRELRVDLVFLGGDFTTTSLDGEFRAARSFVDQLGLPWLAIPGNHDVYTYADERKKTFYRFLENRQLEEGKLKGFSLSQDRVEAYRLDESYSAILIDVCRATNVYSSRGLFSDDLEKKFRDVLSLIPSEDSILVCCHYPFFGHDAYRRTLKRREHLRAILEADPRICLFLHGHTHRHTIADLQPSELPLLLDSGSSAQKKEASWNLIDLQKDGCKVTAYRYEEDSFKPFLTKDIAWKRSGLKRD